MPVNRAILKTWEILARMTRIPNGEFSAHKILWTVARGLTRNWLGFLDGISNMKSEERKDAIYIAPNQVDKELNGLWTVRIWHL